MTLSYNWHATYRFQDIWFLEGGNFTFWGYRGGTEPKRREDLSGTDMYHHANFHADQCEISVTGQKIHIFSCQGSPWGLPSHANILESCPAVELILSSNWHVTLRLNVLEIFGFSESQTFGFRGSPGGTASKGENTDVYHHAEFHPDQCDCRRYICNQT